MAQQGPSEEQKAEALQFKNAGNKAFKAKEWADAVKLYTEVGDVAVLGHVVGSFSRSGFCSRRPSLGTTQTMFSFQIALLRTCRRVWLRLRCQTRVAS